MFVKIKTAVKSVVSFVSQKVGDAKALVAGTLGLGAAAAASNAHAAGGIVDYTSLVTTCTTEITSELPVILPLAGTIMAIFLGWKIVKKFTK